MNTPATPNDLRPLRFVKMHGLGNDFVVIDLREQAFAPDSVAIRRLADRRTGVGFDQLLLLDRASSDADIHWRIFNADGGEVQQCGNGARCVASLLANGQARDVVLEGNAGRLAARVYEDGRVSVDMGVPNFDPVTLPFEPPAADATSADGAYTMRAGSDVVRFGAVSVGNPHIVLWVDDPDKAPVSRLGPLLECHPAFPERTNVGFAQLVSEKRLRLRVWERGSGETRACGTGACAAVAVARSWQQVKEEVTVELPGGELTITWPGPDTQLWMTGPATRAYEGTIETL